MEDFFHYFVKDIVLICIYMYCLYQQMLSDMLCFIQIVHKSINFLLKSNNKQISYYQVQEWINSLVESGDVPGFFSFLPKILLAVCIGILDEIYKTIAKWLNDWGKIAQLFPFFKCLLKRALIEANFVF